MNPRKLHRLAASVLVLCALCASGCGKDKNAAVSPEATDGSADGVANASAKAGGARASAGNRNLDQAREALEIGQYNKAARELLQMKLSGRIRTTEESWRYNQLMTDLQSRLADAAADGDAESRKTMDMLRASSGAR